MITSMIPIELAVATVTEGHCPFCLGRLRRHTEAETAAASTWAHPPSGYCARCDGDVGSYVDGTGAFIGYRNGAPIWPGRDGATS